MFQIDALMFAVCLSIVQGVVLMYVEIGIQRRRTCYSCKVVLLCRQCVAVPLCRPLNVNWECHSVIVDTRRPGIVTHDREKPNVVLNQGCLRHVDIPDQDGVLVKCLVRE